MPWRRANANADALSERLFAVSDAGLLVGRIGPFNGSRGHYRICPNRRSRNQKVNARARGSGVSCSIHHFAPAQSIASNQASSCQHRTAGRARGAARRGQSRTSPGTPLDAKAKRQRYLLLRAAGSVATPGGTARGHGGDPLEDAHAARDCLPR